MAEWYEFAQSIVFGVIFSFLLAKLFSVIFAFRDDNLRIARADPNEEAELEGAQSEQEAGSSYPRVSEEGQPLVSSEVVGENTAAAGVDNRSSSVKADDYDTDSDSDWEGVESTELDETFNAATVFVAATAADRSSQKVSNELQLQLYGLYKIATEGPCTSPQPSALKMTARAKWKAWQKLGTMPPEEAMEKYIQIVTDLYPSWLDGASVNKQGKDTGNASNFESKGPMGPVFSTFAYEDEPGNELKLDAIHAFAREGDEGNLRKCMESGISANVKDSEGRTPLHWAVDRGHLEITKLLLSKNADVNAKDNEGQTPLHYAAVCERAEIAEFLVNNNADKEIKDDDGNSPIDLCELNWPWMQHAASS